MKNSTPHDFFKIADDIANGVRKMFSTTNLSWAMTGEKDGQHQGDVDVDDFVIGHLESQGFATFSEESGWRGDGKYLVVVDPVDGSTNASRGLPSFALSLALIEGDQLIAGVVCDLSNGDEYSASIGDGAALNGIALSKSTNGRPLAKSILALNGYPGNYYGWGQYRALGSAALEVSMVASGKVDAFVDHSATGLAPWDYLGALAIAREVGCSFAWLNSAQNGGEVGDGNPEVQEIAITKDFTVSLLSGRRRLLVARDKSLRDEILGAIRS
ncbi:MAG: inositol monophosphatase family protein [Actinomycetota bacterium]|nr:inositol monophosphatase family protein [Actinomycetota bacterium]